MSKRRHCPVDDCDFPEFHGDVAWLFAILMLWTAGFFALGYCAGRWKVNAEIQEQRFREGRREVMQRMLEQEVRAAAYWLEHGLVKL